MKTLNNDTPKILLLLCIVLLSGCIPFQEKKEYRNTGTRFQTDDFDSLNCEVSLFYHKDSQTPLHGKYRLRRKGPSTMFASFDHGLLEGTCYKFEGRRKVFEGNYHQGIKQGLQIYEGDNWNGNEPYHFKLISEMRNGNAHGQSISEENGTCLQKSLYKNGVKTGKEYYFDNNGDTLLILEYHLDSTHPAPIHNFSDSPPYRYFRPYEYLGKMTINTLYPPDYDEEVALFGLIDTDLKCYKGKYLVIEVEGVESLYVSLQGSTYTIFELE